MRSHGTNVEGDAEVEFLVAPTEPPEFRAIATRVTMFPETKGCDVVWWAQDQWWGIQRKELKDFIASVQGDRLYREMAMMQGTIALPLVLIEGRIAYDLNGNLALSGYGQNFTRSQFRGMLWSVRLHGIAVDFTTSIPDTVEYVKSFARWTAKPRHDSMMTRPGPVSMFGKATNRDFAIHVLQGFEGIGYDTARNMVDKFGGLPLAWSVTERELLQVKGIGKERARKLLAALERDE